MATFGFGILFFAGVWCPLTEKERKGKEYKGVFGRTPSCLAGPTGCAGSLTSGSDDLQASTTGYRLLSVAIMGGIGLVAWISIPIYFT